MQPGFFLLIEPLSSMPYVGGSVTAPALSREPLIVSPRTLWDACSPHLGMGFHYLEPWMLGMNSH